ncbi:alpha/beta hydrolase [Dictyobacter vulcani]|uniref:Alpha/beta hydrolase n=1 Tax=Dictyobacter vulcani TaxID=2607529 RepID=A0A5J4KU15_9CHLR|nr:alpha/beta hydrolase [Dictyobacter vulcani]GER89950.1 alpha/beta hydrolase [Dictyobacter vulcani]
MPTHQLEINGINLHYQTWGEFTRPERTVLLVHGLTASSQEWTQLGPALASQGWYAIAPDLRGRGLSEKPPHGYGIPYHVNDLLSLCDALNLPAVHFIGHSLGAQIGYFLAAVHPQRLSRLVLVDAGGRVPPDTLQAIAASLQRLGQVYPSLDAYIEERRQTPIHQWNPFWEAYYRYDAEVHADGTVTSRVPKAAIEEEITVNMSINADALLPRIQAPTLITRAALGTLAPDRGIILTADEAERVQGIIRGSRVVEIPGTNHYTIMLSDVFTSNILAFLSAIDK